MENNKDRLQSLGDQIDILGQEIIANGFAYIELLRKGEKLNADADYKQNEMLRQFKYIQSTYNAMIKSGRLTGAEGSIKDEDFLARVMKRKSEVFAIEVADITRRKQEEQEKKGDLKDDK